MESPFHLTKVSLLLIGLLTAHFLVERILAYFNLKAMKPDLPKELEGVYDAERYKKSQAYGHENAKLETIASTFTFLFTLSLIVFGLLGMLDEFVRYRFPDSTYLQTASFFVVLMLVSDLISIPFNVYGIFRIEEKYGFNKMTPSTWLFDKIKGYILTFIIGGGLLALFLFLVDSFQNQFWWMFWIATMVFMFLMNVFYVPIFLPLFNKLKPLDAGELKSSIEQYAKENGFPGTEVMVIDGSKRSTKANAFFSGLGKTKRVILYDTLVEKFTVQELVAVLAHEIGHYRKKHIVQGYILSIVQTGLLLFLLSLALFSPELSAALGGNEGSLALNLFALGLLFSPLSAFTGIAGNLLSRKNEYEADDFAKKTSDSKSLSEALIRLHSDSLANLTPHSAYVFFYYSHPTLIQRLNKLKSDS